MSISTQKANANVPYANITMKKAVYVKVVIPAIISKTKNAKKYQVAYRTRKTVTKKKKVLKTYKKKTKKKDAKGKSIYVTKTKWVTKKYKAFKYGKWKYKTTKNANKKIVISHLKRKTYYQVKIRGINGTFKGPWKSGFGMTTK